MKYDPELHHRRSIRLQGYDYSQVGAYFVTIVTQGHRCLFGEIVGQDMQWNAAGECIAAWWQKLPEKFPCTSLGISVVMPNHFHGTIVIQDVGQIQGQTRGSAPTGDGKVGADLRVRPNAPVSEMVQWFKTMTTNTYIRGVKESGWLPFQGRLWQRNYFEHVIRGDEDYERIYNYVEANPVQWAIDEENPMKF